MKKLFLFLICIPGLWAATSTLISCPACMLFEEDEDMLPNVQNIPPHMTLEEFCMIHGLNPEWFTQENEDEIETE